MLRKKYRTESWEKNIKDLTKVIDEPGKLSLPAPPSRPSKHIRSRSDFGLSDHEVKRQEEAQMIRSRMHEQSNQSQVKVVTESILTQPHKDESLIGYLQSQDFHSGADMDRENSHFHILDNLISAIEQTKCNMEMAYQGKPQTFSNQSDHYSKPSSESTPLYNHEDDAMQQRIRFRVKNEKPSATNAYPKHLDDDSQEDDIIDEKLFTRAFQTSPQSVEPVGTTTTFSSNLTMLRNSGLSYSMASMYSAEELLVAANSNSTTCGGDIAEANSASAGVQGVKLLTYFSEQTDQHLPKASEMQWMVSHKQAPQPLLPYPKSMPVSPDGQDRPDRSTRLRGNYVWAPPRAQVILTIHPSYKRSDVLSKQNMQCAGCGNFVESGFSKRFRYCDYIGKYFCFCCHSNKTAYIPARIMSHWDFKKRPVSNIAREFLLRNANEPLFDVFAVNPHLSDRVKELVNITTFREQLFYIYKFLKTCRAGKSLLNEYEKLPTHWIYDRRMFTINELLLIKKKELGSYMNDFVLKGIQHIESCEVCSNLGFICEICKTSQVIYPYQLQTVYCCPDCNSCYHRKCFGSDKCRKCSRIESRKILLAKEDSYEEET